MSKRIEITYGTVVNNIIADFIIISHKNILRMKGYKMQVPLFARTRSTPNC